MIIILDAGHGIETPGKRSPDSSILEYKYCREIMNELKTRLEDLHHLTVYTTVEDEHDTPLSQRCKKVNEICNNTKDSAILISIHLNASGNGDWKSARGWEVWTSKGETESDLLADTLYQHAKKELAGMKLRNDQTDGDFDKEADFYILKHTKCPAVLTENLFQDNKEDVDFLLSKKGKESIINLHLNGIIDYISNF